MGTRITPQPTENPGNNCSICSDLILPNSPNLTTLVCEHVFHTSCINTWLSNKDTCPLCERKITKISPPAEAASHPSEYRSTEEPADAPQPAQSPDRTSTFPIRFTFNSNEHSSAAGSESVHTIHVTTNWPTKIGAPQTFQFELESSSGPPSEKQLLQIATYLRRRFLEYSLPLSALLSDPNDGSSAASICPFFSDILSDSPSPEWAEPLSDIPPPQYSFTLSPSEHPIEPIQATEDDAPTEPDPARLARQLADMFKEAASQQQEESSPSATTPPKPARYKNTP